MQCQGTLKAHIENSDGGVHQQAPLVRPWASPSQAAELALQEVANAAIRPRRKLRIFFQNSSACRTICCTLFSYYSVLLLLAVALAVHVWRKRRC